MRDTKTSTTPKTRTYSTFSKHHREALFEKKSFRLFVSEPLYFFRPAYFSMLIIKYGASINSVKISVSVKTPGVYFQTIVKPLLFLRAPLFTNFEKCLMQ